MGKKKGTAGGGKPKFSVLDMGKGSSDAGGSSAAAAPAKKQPKKGKKAPEPKKSTGYYDFDLPPSDSEEEYETNSGDEGEKQLTKEEEKALKKQAAKDELRRKRKEESLLAASKEARRQAMRGDDNAFDVAFEMPQISEEVMSTLKDIEVHNLTVRAKGKILLENTALTVVSGRKYGLVGPNGKGKSTLLRLLAKRQIPVPDGIDALLVEQEVVGDDNSALQSVVMADVELMALRAEEAELTAPTFGGTGGETLNSM